MFALCLEKIIIEIQSLFFICLYNLLQLITCNYQLHTSLFSKTYSRLSHTFSYLFTCNFKKWDNREDTHLLDESVFDLLSFR